MTELVCELIISLDGFARGQRSPAHYGYFGPKLAVLTHPADDRLAGAENRPL